MGSLPAFPRLLAALFLPWVRLSFLLQLSTTLQRVRVVWMDTMIYDVIGGGEDVCIQYGCILLAS